MTYFFKKWAPRRSPGISKKAGNVTRLKRPKTPTMPSTNDARIDEFCYAMSVCAIHQERIVNTYALVHYTLDQYHTPSDNKCFHRVREGMRLVCPGNVGRGHEQNGYATMSRRGYQLVECPVLQYEADEEHEDPEGPEDGDGGYLAILSVTNP